MPLSVENLAMIEKLVPPVQDVSKINELSSTAFSNYIVAKRTYLISLYETYVGSSLPTDLDIFNSAVTKFSSLETNMSSSLGLDRKESLRDFFLVANGYKEFSGNAYETKMSGMKVENLITLNGQVSVLSSMPSNYFVSGGLGSIDTMATALVPATVTSSEKSTAAGFQGTMSNEIITSAMNKIWEDKKPFFTEFLKFKNWVV